MEDLVQKLDELPPLDEATFKAKLNDIISAYTKGKDTATLRIVVKKMCIRDRRNPALTLQNACWDVSQTLYLYERTEDVYKRQG